MLTFQANNMLLSTSAGDAKSPAGSVGCVLLLIYRKNVCLEKVWLLWHKLKEGSCQALGLDVLNA